MLDVGFSELLVFGIIALLVLGPDKLPEAARFAAKWYSKFKRVISNVQNDIDRELRLSEFREQMQNEMQRIQELEQKVQAQMQELQQQSITAAEKELPTASSSNKNLSLTYHFIQPTVPSFYLLETWIKQQQCSYVYIPPVKTVYQAQLQVAV
ncbi:Sec-independent protein translocase protein TatB [Acinetobacter sp. ANC 4648]|uniref:Sec-independent protein translocase protein TatB n=1 Tax=Acinetobacter sp. ANC 4648 TaxID=1977875 RepID=UPI000A3564B5|nr:Sec-independent protein translocase protein TatB [Acinetobacter sp. ANC 4648]OTG84012.1 twin-arginine translocase subunit TatB [Acinetobacter sp. ANC 4648]